jgi:hypothetical protein
VRETTPTRNTAVTSENVPTTPAIDGTSTPTQPTATADDTTNSGARPVVNSNSNTGTLSSSNTPTPPKQDVSPVTAGRVEATKERPEPAPVADPSLTPSRPEPSSREPRFDGTLTRSGDPLFPDGGVPFDNEPLIPPPDAASVSGGYARSVGGPILSASAAGAAAGESALPVTDEAPAGADLSGASWPHDPAALAAAVQQFLGKLGQVSQVVSRTFEGYGWAPPLLLLALLLGAYEMSRRRGRGGETSPAGDDPFPVGPA